MSSLVLLDKQGAIAHKLQLVSLPDDYVVPLGMTVSWKTVVHVSSSHQLEEMGIPLEPVEAYFYLGKAQGVIHRNGFEVVEQEKSNYPTCFGSRILTVVVQGTVAKDIMDLRDHMMCLINTGSHWKVHNDLNPGSWKSFLKSFKKKMGFVLKQNPT